MKNLPLAFIIFRAAAGLALPAIAFLKGPPMLMAALYLAGFLSDIFDGVIARRTGVSTLRLRHLDSRADILFFIGAISAACIQNPALGRDWIPWIFFYGGLFLLRNAVDYMRYRASPSYHMWSGKIWATVISIYLFCALLGADSAILVPVSFVIYAVNAVEGIAASLLYPYPAVDVPSLWHAWKGRHLPRDGKKDARWGLTRPPGDDSQERR